MFDFQVSLVNRSCRFVICSGSLDIIRGAQRWLLVMIPLIAIVVVRFDTYFCTLIFKTNNEILSPKYNIFIRYWEY